MSRGPQLGLSFVPGDPLYRRLSAVARTSGLRETRVIREVVSRYLDLWAAERRAESDRIALRMRGVGRGRRGQ